MPPGLSDPTCDIIQLSNNVDSASPIRIAQKVTDLGTTLLKEGTHCAANFGASVQIRISEKPPSVSSNSSPHKIPGGSGRERHHSCT